ncbi:ependymin-like [Pholidichthys leucotaenia]
MRFLVVLACFLAASLAEEELISHPRPKPCQSPPFLAGALTMSTQNEKLWTYARYMYDALGQQMRLWEFGSYQNKSFTIDVLLQYRQGVLYVINDKERTCTKQDLKSPFHPMEIPKNASLVGQAIVGSSSGPGQGLLVNTWLGDLPGQSGKYITTFTEFGCIPITTAYQTKEFGWVVVSLFNNVIGILDPNLFIPPDYCPPAEAKSGAEEAGDFLSVFQKIL